MRPFSQGFEKVDIYLHVTHVYHTSALVFGSQWGTGVEMEAAEVYLLRDINEWERKEGSLIMLNCERCLGKNDKVLRKASHKNYRWKEDGSKKEQVLSN